ncbi:MAG TPA: NfeD family protein, partial [Lacunisphaera sp.]
FSGHEPLLLFVVGLLLVILEILFFPGVTVVAACGLLSMLGALVWAMADLWPGQPITVAWSGDAFVAPLQNLGLGLAIAAGMAYLLMRFLPHGWLWGRLAVTGAVHGTGTPLAEMEAQESLVGLDGVAATGLFPSGQVEINGRRYEARVEVGTLTPGTRIRVVRRTGFNLVVEAKRS